MRSQQTANPSVLACCLSFPQAAAPGIAISRAASGREAMELLGLRPFDLVLTGPRLPDMSLADLAGALRRWWPGQPWALVGEGVTAADEMDARWRGAAGVCDVVAGEFLEELLGCLRRARRPCALTAAPRPVPAMKWIPTTYRPREGTVP